MPRFIAPILSTIILLAACAGEHGSTHPASILVTAENVHAVQETVRQSAALSAEQKQLFSDYVERMAHKKTPAYDKSVAVLIEAQRLEIRMRNSLNIEIVKLTPYDSLESGPSRGYLAEFRCINQLDEELIMWFGLIKITNSAGKVLAHRDEWAFNIPASGSIIRNEKWSLSDYMWNNLVGTDLSALSVEATGKRVETPGAGEYFTDLQTQTMQRY